MAWLWLISVGMTDVQFPVCQRDVLEQQNVLFRFEAGRAGLRAVHEGLLELLRRNAIDFPDQLPDPLSSDDSRNLRLEFIHDEGALIASVRAAEGDPDKFRISAESSRIPNGVVRSLPLYCPKVHELIDAAKQSFGADPVTVVVLNTCRDASTHAGKDEPVGSGPIVARYLAQRLHLGKVNSDGRIPSSLARGVSTWVNVLIGKETAEDRNDQERIVRRINQLVLAWKPKANDKILVTNSGGIPPLKPIFERVAACGVGQNATRVLDAPDRRGGPPASVAVLNFNDRVAEREALRFHCLEALRAKDLAGAYGVARRTQTAPWSEMLLRLLGTLLELPNDGGLSELQNSGLALTACQIEARIYMDDAFGACLLLKRFFDMAKASGKCRGEEFKAFRGRYYRHVSDVRNQLAHNTDALLSQQEAKCCLENMGLRFGRGFGRGFLEHRPVVSILGFVNQASVANQISQLLQGLPKHVMEARS
jgi:hypothetical protein